MARIAKVNESRRLNRCSEGSEIAMEDESVLCRGSNCHAKRISNGSAAMAGEVIRAQIVKPVRRKVVQYHPPRLVNGMWVRLVKLSCGHEQLMARTDYSRTGRTIVCHRCSEPRE